MQIGAMNHPARNPIDEINWIGQHGFDFVDFTFEPLRFRSANGVKFYNEILHESDTGLTTQAIAV